MPTIAEALQIGLAHQQAGRLPQAEQIYRNVLQVEPRNAAALHLLGLIAHQVGKNDIAVQLIDQAIDIDPGQAAFHANLGLAYRGLGHLDKAIACYQRALELDPRLVTAQNNLGETYRQQGRTDQALACFRAALAVRPDYGEAHSNLGLTLQALDQIDAAVAAFQQARHALPRSIAVLNNLAVALMKRGDLAESEHTLEQACRLDPNFPGTQLNLGNLYRDQGQSERAMESYRRALQFAPHSADVHNNLALLLSEQGRLSEALASFERAIELEPDDPQAHYNRSRHWLLAGNFEQGWPEYEWRWQTIARPRPFSQPVWDGSPLDGRTILLHSEQGIGDTLQFVRYAQLVKQRSGQVILELHHPSLARLLARAPGVDRLVVAGEPLPDFDVHAPLMSLPGIMRTSLATIPASIPYLSAPPERIEAWRRELADLRQFRIGLVWQGNPRLAGDRFRSYPLRLALALAEIPTVRLYSLQKGAGCEQLLEASQPAAIEDLGPRLDDFCETAAAIQNLHLVIACDTAVAHLAGALGVPVWIALPVAPDWRWLLDREDSPWYPSARLFRQRTGADRAEVFQRMAAALRQLVA